MIVLYIDFDKHNFISERKNFACYVICFVYQYALSHMCIIWETFGTDFPSGFYEFVSYLFMFCHGGLIWKLED